jgi:rare lipoprotein A
MRKLMIVLSLLLLVGCSSGSLYETEGGSKIAHKKYGSSSDNSGKTVESKGRTVYMVSSYYGSKFHGRQTSNGEIFDMYKFTCAHKTLPFNTKLKVTNEDNGKYVIVRVNDRGPFVYGRDLDLSYAAAREIGLISEGVKEVKVEILNDK